MLVLSVILLTWIHAGCITATHVHAGFHKWYRAKMMELGFVHVLVRYALMTSKQYIYKKICKSKRVESRNAFTASSGNSHTPTHPRKKLKPISFH